MIVFPPANEALAFGENAYVFWDDGFTADQIQLIELAAELAPPQEAQISSGVNRHYRSSEVRWIAPDLQYSWVGKLAWIIQRLNGQYYGMDVTGFGENFQHTTYHPAKGKRRKGDHYDWHMDMGASTEVPRKLSVVMLLPGEFEGGSLQIMTSRDPINVELKPGRVVMFPSYVMHRVTPVTSGVRKTLVAWVSGPRLR